MLGEIILDFFFLALILRGAARSSAAGRAPGRARELDERGILATRPRDVAAGKAGAL